MARIGGEAVGVAFYQPQGGQVYFSRLSVLPTFRNRGVGRALIEYVERRALETGAAGVRLGVRLQLPHLIARYERLGYCIAKYMTHDGYAQRPQALPGTNGAHSQRGHLSSSGRWP